MDGRYKLPSGRKRCEYVSHLVTPPLALPPQNTHTRTLCTQNTYNKIRLFFPRFFAL